MFNEKKFIKKQPLVLFSVYTEIQKDCLYKIGEDLIKVMKKFSPTRVDGNFTKAYGLFWLWILGSYEVIRVMSANPDCFNSKTNGKIKIQKKKLAKIRIPFAKQERQGAKKNKYNIGTDLSVNQIVKGDIGFTIDGENYFFKPLFKEFKELLSKIKPTDIKCSLEDNYLNS